MKTKEYADLLEYLKSWEETINKDLKNVSEIMDDLEMDETDDDGYRDSLRETFNFSEGRLDMLKYIVDYIKEV